MPGYGGQQLHPVLADLGVAPLGQGDRLAASGGDLLVQHRPARLALGGLDQVADLLPLLHVVDEVQGGVVHLVVLVHLQHPLNDPGEVVNNVAVLAVEGGLPLGDQKQVEVPALIPGDVLHHPHIHAVGDPLLRQAQPQDIPGHLLALSHRREDDNPGVELVGGDKEAGERVQAGGEDLLRFRRLFSMFFPLSAALFSAASGLLQPRAADAGEDRLQAVLLPLYHIRREDAVLVQAQAGRGQAAGLLPAQVVQAVELVVRGQNQQGGVGGLFGGRLGNRLHSRLRLRLRGLIRCLCRSAAKQEGRELVFDGHFHITTFTQECFLSHYIGSGPR